MLLLISVITHTINGDVRHFARVGISNQDLRMINFGH